MQNFNTLEATNAINLGHQRMSHLCRPGPGACHVWTPWRMAEAVDIFSERRATHTQPRHMSQALGHSHWLYPVNARRADAWHTSQMQRESQLCSHRKRSARHTLIISQRTLVPFVRIMVPLICMMRKDCRLVILLWNKNHPVLFCQVSGSVSLHRKQLNNYNLSY